jgi:hypothetical protein
MRLRPRFEHQRPRRIGLHPLRSVESQHAGHNPQYVRASAMVVQPHDAIDSDIDPSRTHPQIFDALGIGELGGKRRFVDENVDLIDIDSGPFKTRNDVFRQTGGRPAVFRFGLRSSLESRIGREVAAVRSRGIAIPGTLGRIAPPVSDALYDRRRISSPERTPPPIGNNPRKSVGNPQAQPRVGLRWTVPSLRELSFTDSSG